MSVYGSKNPMAAFLNEQPENPTLDTVRFVFHFCNLVNLTLGAIAFGAGILFGITPINAENDSSLNQVQTKFLVTGIFVVIHGIIGAYGCVSKQSRCLVLYGMLGVCLLVVGATAAWTAFLKTEEISVQARNHFFRVYFNFVKEVDIEEYKRKAKAGKTQTSILTELKNLSSGADFVWEKIYIDEDCQMDGWENITNDATILTDLFKDKNVLKLKTLTSMQNNSYRIKFSDSGNETKYLDLNVSWKEHPSQTSIKLLQREPDNTTIHVNYEYRCGNDTQTGSNTTNLTYLHADTWSFNNSSSNFSYMVKNLVFFYLSKSCSFNKAMLTRVNGSVVMYTVVDMINPKGNVSEDQLEKLIDKYDTGSNKMFLPKTFCLDLIKQLTHDRVITMYAVLFLLSVTQSVCLVCNILFIFWSLKEEADETEKYHKEKSLKIRIFTQFLPCCFKVPDDYDIKNDLSDIVDEEEMSSTLSPQSLTMTSNSKSPDYIVPRDNDDSSRIATARV